MDFPGTTKNRIIRSLRSASQVAEAITTSPNNTSLTLQKNGGLEYNQDQGPTF